MFELASASAVIACTRERAFRYTADLAHFDQWFPGVLAVHPRDATPFASAGKTYDEQLAMPLGRVRAVVIRVVDVEPGHRLVTEGTLPVVLPRMEIDFMETGAAGCTVRWRMMSRSRALLARWTILPLARRTMQRRADIAMVRLRERLESGLG